ncbi:type II toxin-antitoxin system HicB family antitoxin [Pantanalinema rosaneae CENA516]|uniref:type II toxin-antitoxin system HicB family antitoxin n=1 Tax=Pantanalinema rosaneae TaxID=1620701 RepID=UPI003D6FD0D9
MLAVNIQIQKSGSGYTAYSPEISELQVHGESLDSVVNEIKEIIRDYLEHPEQPASDSTGRSLLDLFAEVTADMTEDEVAQLPKDGAEQHDHYIYGTPKRLL